MAAPKILLFLVVTVAICKASNGVCNLSVMDLMRCMPAVSSDTPAKPSEACCGAVRSLTVSDFQCLCDYKTNHPGDLQQYGVNPALAAALPGNCGVQNALPCA